MTAAAFSAERLIGLRLLAGRGPAAYWPLLLAALALLLCWKSAGASEFPERECCDDLILLPPAVDAGPDIRKTVPLGGNGGVGVGGTTSSSSSFSTETPPHSSSEHPDTSNFLYPEFIPELSLDLGYPLPPPPLHPHHQHPHPAAPDGSNYVPTTTGTGLHQGQPASAILNCLLAHQLCAEDPSCKSIETVIQHICGPETVACSTTTVTKCQAGLRTLQAFPVFHPTCLCREPSVDPDCNAFRDSLFDHPCMVATQKERDLYPIHALPTCTHALDVCQKDLSCTRLYNDFREHCKLRSGVCRDKETCYNAWRGLRMTPLFGCFCPGNDQKKCERIYSFIYNNTCVGYPTPSGHVIRNRSESSVTATPLSDSTTTSRVYASRRRMRRYLVRYLPHHLTPPPSTTHLHNQSAPQSSSTSSSPSSTSSVDDGDDNELALDTTATTNIVTATDPPSLLPTSTDVISTSTPPSTTTTTTTKHEHHLVGTATTTSTTVTPTVPTAHHLLLLGETTSLDPADDVAASWQDSLNRQRETDGRQIESRLMDSVHHHHHHGTAAEAGSIDVARFSHFLQSALTRTRIGYHSSSSSVSSIHAASAAAAAAAASGSVAAGATSNGSASYYSTSSSSSFNTSTTSSNHTGGDEVMDGGAGRVVSIYQSTCHRALTHCQSDLQCRKHLDPFLRYCNGGGVVSGMAGGADTCHRDLCMQALQGFYKDAPLQWSLEVAFCVCKKSQSRNDECLVAQERLHPDCARRPERYHLPPPPPPASGGGGATSMGGSMASSSPALGTNEASPPHHTPACHHLAEECKAHPDCKPRLEFYVQACAVDIVTKGCAGPPSICRRAVLDILGTDLRTTCTCRTAQHLGDMAAMYDCTEWQRLLWLNPCVVEAQRDFHKIQGNLKVVTVPTPTLAPTVGVDGSSATVRGRQTSSVEDDPSHHLFTVVVPRRTLRPQETQQSPGDGGGQRFPMTSSTDATSGGSSTVTWTTSTGTRFSTGSTASGGPTTTEMITRPTIPAKYCTLERPNKRVVHFPEGTSKRLYHDDDPDCSELCRCGAGQVVTCSISDCAERIPCQTSAAVYAHAATAFQAYRGECLCFSGTLVCARPDPGQYSLPLGVFLFVGYSRADEKAIYQFTHTNVSRSLLTGLHQLMYISLPETSENECRMSIHDQLEENVIFQIRLPSLDDQRVNNSVTLEMLTHEKGQCLPVANRLRQMISKRLPDIREDEALSIVKVADTATVLPEPRRSSAGRHQMCWTILAAVWSSSLILTNRFYS